MSPSQAIEKIRTVWGGDRLGRNSESVYDSIKGIESQIAAITEEMGEVYYMTYTKFGVSMLRMPIEKEHLVSRRGKVDEQ